jgi:hypothetical protein
MSYWSLIRLLSPTGFDIVLSSIPQIGVSICSKDGYELTQQCWVKEISPE